MLFLLVLFVISFVSSCMHITPAMDTFLLPTMTSQILNSEPNNNEFFDAPVQASHSIEGFKIKESRSKLEGSKQQRTTIEEHLQIFRKAQASAAKIFVSSTTLKQNGYSDKNISTPSPKVATNSDDGTINTNVTTNIEKPLRTENQITTEKPRLEGIKLEEMETTNKEEAERSLNLFEALKITEMNMCTSCPPLFMIPKEEISILCSNWENVKSSFAISLDSQNQVIDAQTTISHCTRTVRCTQPYMLVKWHESNMCDVHTADERGSFDYQCNGTHWTIHGFPIDNIICGQKKPDKI